MLAIVDGPAAAARPARRRCSVFLEAPPRGGHPAHGLRPAQGRGAAAHPRGPQDRGREPRSGHRAHPRRAGSGDGARGPDERSSACRDPGAGDPRHAPPAPHRPRARQDHRGVRRGASSRSRASEQILADEREVSKIIVEELRAIREKYGDERRTQIVDEAAEISIEDLIVEEDMVVTISHEGYIKRNPVSLYRAQRRGGRGKIGATHARRGLRRAPLRRLDALLPPVLHHHREGVLAQGPRDPAGRPRGARAQRSTTCCSLKPEEKLSAFLPVREFQEGRYVVFATRRGLDQEDRPHAVLDAAAVGASSPSRSRRATR